MATQATEAIPARRGKAARVRKGQRIKMINTHGTQVVDTWAFNAEDLHEFMSMEHTRPHIGHIMPRVGDVMFTNKRRPILTIVEDSSPGIHDTIIAACDRYRYKFLGVEGYHDNCTDNLYAGMAELGLTPPEVPSPFNVWMNIPVAPDGSVEFRPTVSKPGGPSVDARRDGPDHRLLGLPAGHPADQQHQADRGAFPDPLTAPLRARRSGRTSLKATRPQTGRPT